MTCASSATTTISRNKKRISISYIVIWCVVFFSLLANVTYVDGLYNKANTGESYIDNGNDAVIKSRVKAKRRKSK